MRTVNANCFNEDHVVKCLYHSFPRIFLYWPLVLHNIYLYNSMLNSLAPDLYYIDRFFLLLFGSTIQYVRLSLIVQMSYFITKKAMQKRLLGFLI